MCSLLHAGSSERSPFSRKRRSSSGGGSLKAGAGGSGGSPKLSPHHPASDHSHHHHHHHHPHHPHPHHPHHHILGRRLTRSLSESSLLMRRRSGRTRSQGELQVTHEYCLVITCCHCLPFVSWGLDEKRVLYRPVLFVL